MDQKIVISTIISLTLIVMTGCNDGYPKITSRTKDSLKGIMRLELKTNKKLYKSGEKILVHEQLFNNTNADFGVRFKSFSRECKFRHEADEVNYIINNELPPYRDFPNQVFVTHKGLSILKSNNSLTEEYEFTILEPGEYTLKSTWRSDPLNRHEHNFIKGDVHSELINITITP